MSKLLVVFALVLLSCETADESKQSSDAGNTSSDAGNTSGDAGNTSNDTGPPPVEPSGVSIVDGELFVDGEPFFIQGVAWSPVAVGNFPPADFAGYVEQDSEMIAAAGLNVVRTYGTITERAVLDRLYERGIYVMNSVYLSGGDSVEDVRGRVESVADHPAILMWLIGNEWNYNGLYQNLSFEESLQRLNEVAEVIREVNTSIPIATVYGELPSRETIEAMPLIDVWGINAYRGIGFGALFDEWQERSEKPMFLAEFGADAWNANIGAEDQAAQAEATVALIAEISANRPSKGGPCLGGALFEWSDEWWKDSAGSPDEHDVGGVAPGGGPHPDQTFNEEWWGLVEVDRTPRQAYLELPATW